jgi:hypothetical protein
MASLTKDKSGSFHIHFRFGGRQFHKSLKTDDEKIAESMKGRIEMTLRDIELGRLTPPPAADFWQLVLSDGKLHSRPRVGRSMILDDLFRWYFDNQTEGAKEKKTLETERLHSRHFLRLLDKTRTLLSPREQEVRGRRKPTDGCPCQACSGR